MTTHSMQSELQEFVRFASRHVEQGADFSSVEELVKLWRQNSEYAEAVADVRQGISDEAACKSRPLADALAEIEVAIQGLADTAPRYPLARESDAFSFPVHQCNFGVSNNPTHRILFSFDDTQVLVYSVRHLSQSDLPPDEIE